MKTRTWYQGVEHCHAQGKGYVLITVLASAGSTPRSQGTKMVVTDDQIFETIGGGHLEYEVIDYARNLLAKNKQLQSIQHYPLASKLGQCCGGATNVMFEVINEHCQPLWIFGAGHVAKSLITIVSQLPLQVRWIDQRKEMFDLFEFESNSVKQNVTQVVNEYPADELSDLPSNTWVIVMTHSHSLDYEIVKTALASDKVNYLGMIGSETKARRFKTRLSHQGIQSTEIDKLTSPIGLADIPGKKPVEVAVSIAGQLIQLLNKDQSNNPINAQEAKLSWQQTKKIANLL